MGYAVIGGKSTPQIQRHIRTVARVTGSVFFTKHANTQMRKRRIGMPEVLDCLRTGVIRLTPEPNPSKGSLECRMERYVGGRECFVVVALCDEDPDLLIVTVI